jgi:O-antigen/teichoic acid export membrane protein
MSRLSRNTLALLVSNGGSALLSFGLSILIGRVLGENGLGIYATVLAWVYPLSLITEFGLGTLITRDVAQDPDQAHAYILATVRLRGLIGGGLLALVLIFAPQFSDNASISTGLRIAAPLLVILPLYSGFTAVFRAHQIMIPIALLNLGMLIAQVSLTALAFWWGYGIIGALSINTLTSLGQLLAAYAVYRLRFYRAHNQQLALRPLLQHALPFAIAAILAALQSRVNILLLERHSPLAQVGYYAAALRFIEAGRLLPHAFFDALFPLLSSLAADPLRLERVFRRVMLGLLGFGLVFALSITAVSDWLLPVTYGEAFVPAVEVLQLAVWGLLFMVLKSGRILYWYAQGDEGFVNRMTAITIGVQILLAWWLIPSYGAIGAGLVYILSEALGFGLLFMRRSVI